MKIPQTYYTRAKYLLRTWGEYTRIEWLPDNGLQKSSLYKKYGDLYGERSKQAETLAAFMANMRESQHDYYELAVLIYVDQKTLPRDAQRSEVRRLRDRLCALHKKIILEFYGGEIENINKMQRAQRNTEYFESNA